MKITRNVLAISAAVGVAAAGGSALTAANTGTPLTSAGQGATVTTGFAVSNVDYTLAPTANATGDQLASVEFTLTASGSNNIAQEARVQLVSTGAYYTCAVVAGAVAPAVNWTCATSGLQVSTIDTLDIVAVSNSV
jgi:hypothetical protein